MGTRPAGASLRFFLDLFGNLWYTANLWDTSVLSSAKKGRFNYVG